MVDRSKLVAINKLHPRLGRVEGVYFIDTHTYEVWSFAQRPEGMRLSITTNGGIRYVKFRTSNRPWDSMSIRFDALVSHLNTYLGLKVEHAVGNQFAAAVTVNTSTDTRKFVIGSITSTGVSFSTNPKVHIGESTARAECERLATIIPSKKFALFELIDTCQATGVSWGK